MTTLYILTKNNIHQHVYSVAKRDEMIKFGWRLVYIIKGYNMNATATQTI